MKKELKIPDELLREILEDGETYYVRHYNQIEDAEYEDM